MASESTQKTFKKEDMVKLISAEGFEFVIDKKAAMVSQTIHNMLTSPGPFPYSFLPQLPNPTSFFYLFFLPFFDALIVFLVYCFNFVCLLILDEFIFPLFVHVFCVLA